MLTPAEEYEKLAQALHHAQEAALNISHLRGMEGDKLQAEQWLQVSELYKANIATVRNLFVGARS